MSDIPPRGHDEDRSGSLSSPSVSGSHPRSLYQRITRSPYLDPTLHDSLERLLSPDEVLCGFNQLIMAARAHARVEIIREEIGSSASGRALLGWRVRLRASKQAESSPPIILSASQHHGPENQGASVALYFSHLLLSDPLAQPLLDHYQFVFFPQQNPDALDLRGNLTWMRAFNEVDHQRGGQEEQRDQALSAFLSHHQYDPRSLDVEHGVPASVMSSIQPREGEGRLTGFKRPETCALIRWVDQALAAGDKISAYLTGHAWNILHCPLYLISGSPASYQSQREWIELTAQWSHFAPYKLNESPPLSADYILQPPLALDTLSDLSPPQPGVYQAPQLDDFQAQNHQSKVRYSTLAYIESRAPEAVVVVLEPPIFDSEVFSDPSRSLGHLKDLRTSFLDACDRHDALIQLINQALSSLWQSETSDTLEAMFVCGGGLGEGALKARVALEVMEQGETLRVWSRFFQRLDSGELAMSVTPSQLSVATATQGFATINLAASFLRLTEQADSSLAFDELLCSRVQALDEAARADLKRFRLAPFKIREASFVYLSALLSATGITPSN